MQGMAAGNQDRTGELRISLEQLLVVQDEEAADDYRDNHVRRMSGSILLASGEPENGVKIGEVELIYFGGSRAVDNGLDILDVADSVGEEAYRYAKAVYAGGVLDRDLVTEPMSNDLLAVSSVTILPEYRGHEYGMRGVRKITETVGYHCGAVVMRSEDRLGAAPEIIAEEEPGYGGLAGFLPTNDPSVLLVVSY